MKMTNSGVLKPVQGLLAGATAVLLVAAAAQAPAQAQTRGASATVRVSVVDGAIRVSTDAAVLAAGVSTITWQMATPGWSFANGSIDFGDAARSFNCRVFNEGAAISCNRSSSAQGQVPYRIRLSNGGALTALPQPFIYISLE
jgi:hypothetical protein